MINNFDITFAAENTIVADSSNFVIQGVAGTQGTGLATILQVGANEVMVFCQDAEGNDVEYGRNDDTGMQSNGTRDRDTVQVICIDASSDCR